MSGTVIGRVKSGTGKYYDVKWDQASKDSYVSYAGWCFIGKASSATAAMTKAEAFVYSK